MSRKKTRNRSNKAMYYGVGGAVLLVVVLISIQLFTTSTSGVGPDYYADFPQSVTSIGPADAPVHVIEYVDFQCPACIRASDSIVKPIIDNYVTSGDVRFTYRFFPILGVESVAASEASYCAVLQDAFWPYQHELFAKNGTGNRGTFSERNLIAIADDLGLDVELFTECLRGTESSAYVQLSFDHAAGLGLRGTPSFFVNGQFVNANPQLIFDEIEKAIEASKADGTDANASSESEM